MNDLMEKVQADFRTLCEWIRSDEPAGQRAKMAALAVELGNNLRTLVRIRRAAGAIQPARVNPTTTTSPTRPMPAPARPGVPTARPLGRSDDE